EAFLFRAADSHTELDEMLVVGERGIILKLIIRGVVESGKCARAARGEGALYRDDRQRGVAYAVIRSMVILEAGFIHRPRSDDLRLGNLSSALMSRVGRLTGREIETSNSCDRVVSMRERVAPR